MLRSNSKKKVDALIELKDIIQEYMDYPNNQRAKLKAFNWSKKYGYNWEEDKRFFGRIIR